MTTTDKTGAEQAPGWAKPCPHFTREPLARFGCAHCGHAGDYLAALVAPPCPECGQPLQALPWVGLASEGQP